MIRLLKFFGFIVLLYLLLYLYDQWHLQAIPPKQDDSLRIGYLNLYSSQLAKADLQRMKQFDCDLWLFIEWNGDNLDNLPAFESGYHSILEEPNDRTYGIHVLSKLPNSHATEFGKQSNRNFTCNYPMHQLKVGIQDPLEIILLHAPPPVPDCDFQTDDYIDAFLNELQHHPSNPDFIIGDLNTMPFQPAITDIESEEFSDAHKTLHWWPEGTFSFFSWFPSFIQLDYVFHHKNIQPTTAERFSVSSSDHDGWVVDVQHLE